MNQVQNKSAGKPPGKFRLDKQNGKLMGVCAGLADYFGWDPLIVRLIFVIGAVAGVGSFIIIYLAIGLLADG